MWIEIRAKIPLCQGLVFYAFLCKFYDILWFYAECDPCKGFVVSASHLCFYSLYEKFRGQMIDDSERKTYILRNLLFSIMRFSPHRTFHTFTDGFNVKRKRTCFMVLRFQLQSYWLKAKYPESHCIIIQVWLNDKVKNRKSRPKHFAIDFLGIFVPRKVNLLAWRPADNLCCCKLELIETVPNIFLPRFLNALHLNVGPLPTPTSP